MFTLMSVTLNSIYNYESHSAHYMPFLFEKFAYKLTKQILRKQVKSRKQKNLPKV